MGEELIFMTRATGFRIYVCRPDANGKPAWTLKAPDAELFDEQGKSIGKHFGGPTWQLKDGSQITGKMAAKVDAPDPKAISWLLVTVTGHSGSGKLSGVYVHPASEYGGRSSTDGRRMHIAERGSGVQEQLFRRLLLLRAGMKLTWTHLRRSRNSKDSRPPKTKCPEPRERRRAVISAGVGVRDLVLFLLRAFWAVRGRSRPSGLRTPL